jgi:hypothetical protein
MAGMKDRLIGKHAGIAILVVCFGTFPHSSGQQLQTGQISGHVGDVQGASIDGASVFVRKHMPAEENVKLLTHTDTHGDFMLVLPEGGYDVLITSQGFAASVETVPVLGRKTRKVEWNLKALKCDFPGMNCDTFQ